MNKQPKPKATTASNAVRPIRKSSNAYALQQELAEALTQRRLRPKAIDALRCALRQLTV